MPEVVHLLLQVFVPREDLSLDVIKQYRVVSLCSCVFVFLVDITLLSAHNRSHSRGGR